MTRGGATEGELIRRPGVETLRNAATGMQIRIIRSGEETAGRLLELEGTYPPNGPEPLLHYHPGQDEEFVIRAGRITAMIAGERMEARVGSVLKIPAGTPHAMWNEGSDPCIVTWLTMPALQTEQFFRDVYRLAAEGRTDGRGTPGVLDLAWLVPHYWNEIRITRPPERVQRIVFGILGRFVRSRHARFRVEPDF